MNYLIWGASRGGMEAIKHIVNFQPEDKILAVYDRDPAKWGKEIGGFPIKSPEFLLDDFHNNDSRILISSQFIDQIVAAIAQMQEERRKSVLDDGKNPLDYVDTFVTRSFLARDDYPFIHDLDAIYAEDAINSRYIDLIRNGMIRQNKIFPYSAIRDLGDITYFDVLFGDNLKKLDCSYIDLGSCDGDSIFQVYDALGDGLKEVLAIEPSPDNMEILKNNIMTNKELNALVRPIHAGLGQERRKTRFGGSGIYFAESENGEFEVDILPLDDLQDQVSYHPLIKMDVEGAELGILQGGENFIREKRPIMAVCVYHREHDFYTLPAYLKSLVPDYKFYMRGGTHLVCYAVPEEFAHLVETPEDNANKTY